MTHVTTGAWDFNDNLRIATEYNNTFSTPIFAQRAIDIINQWGPGGAGAASGQPLFLYLAWQDVHWPLQAPQAYLDRFANATGGNAERQAVCAMAAHMDDGLGNVTAALKANGLYDDTVMVFVSDNGGPEHNNEGTWSSNYPLRGGKNTLWVSEKRAGLRFSRRRLSIIVSDDHSPGGGSYSSWRSSDDSNSPACAAAFILFSLSPAGGRHPRDRHRARCRHPTEGRQEL